MDLRDCVQRDGDAPGWPERVRVDIRAGVGVAAENPRSEVPSSRLAGWSVDVVADDGAVVAATLLFDHGETRRFFIDEGGDGRAPMLSAGLPPLLHLDGEPLLPPDGSSFVEDAPRVDHPREATQRGDAAIGGMSAFPSEAVGDEEEEPAIKP